MTETYKVSGTCPICHKPSPDSLTHWNCVSEAERNKIEFVKRDGNVYARFHIQRPIFEFTPNDGGPSLMFDINEITDAILLDKVPYEFTRVEIDKNHATKLVRDGSIEINSITFLLSNRLRREAPIIIVEMPDGTHIVIDGNNRYVTKASMGHKSISAAMVKFVNIKQFVKEIKQ